MDTQLSWPVTDLGAPSRDLTVGDLAQEVPVLPGTASCQDLDRVFRRDRDAACAVVAHPEVTGLVGLVERSRFEALMSGPYGYGRSLYGRRDLADVTQWDALTVAVTAPVVEAASRAITRAPEHVQDHVLVTGPEGVRAVPLPTLLAAVARTLADEALRDPLTGLANRNAFFGRVEESCRRSATQAGHRTAVVYLDLDGFKSVNDDLGHDVGDALLRDVATALRSAARPADLVARLGGDEFAVCLDVDGESSGEGEDDPVRAVAVRLHDAVAALRRSSGAGQRVRISAGVAVGGGGGVDAGELVRAADLAMYTGKREGGDRVTGPVRVTRSAEADPLVGTSIAEAGARGELVLRYQPIVDLASGRPVSVEALVRWEHPRLGLLTPDAFLHAVARAGQLLDLDAWVLRTATAEFARWRRGHPAAPAVALNLNVSTDRLLTPGLCALLGEATVAAGLPPSLVRVEVPEHLLVEQIEAASGPLTELRAAGFRVTFDDVGAGGTSLRHLREVRADGLKIDRSYVQGMADDDRDRALVQLLVDFADSTGLAVTAEGVETETEREQLLAMGCRYGQGWLFGRPGTLDAALTAGAVPVG